jgi:hypothetical protein
MLNHAHPKNVRLRHGREVVLRPLARDDFGRLYSFFQAIPEEDRLYLAHDMSDPGLIRKWTDELDFERVIPSRSPPTGLHGTCYSPAVISSCVVPTRACFCRVRRPSMTASMAPGSATSLNGVP